MGHISHQHVFSPRVLANVRLMARDTDASLWSNSLSTPIAPFQDRGFRESYVSGSVSATYGRHELKAGAEAIFGSVHESFAYRITAYRLNPGNVRIFDRDLRPHSSFSNKARIASKARLYKTSGIPEPYRHRRSAIRHYRLVAHESAWSPRLGIAYYVPAAKLVLRASYDRTFETPAVENILLASSNLLSAFGGEGAFLPLKPGNGNYYEAGFSKAIGGRIRFDGTWFRRQSRNFPDDSLLLNSGVSFPIAFSKGEIYGYEAKVDMPRWGPFSGFVSYSNLVGRGYGPVSGGLFLGDDAGELLESTAGFPTRKISGIRPGPGCEFRHIPGSGLRWRDVTTAACRWRSKALLTRRSCARSMENASSTAWILIAGAQDRPRRLMYPPASSYGSGNAGPQDLSSTP